jgi:hypothetical protein
MGKHLGIIEIPHKGIQRSFLYDEQLLVSELAFLTAQKEEVEGYIDTCTYLFILFRFRALWNCILHLQRS